MGNSKYPIVVCQLSFKGATNNGKWYIYRGNKYLRNDGTWHESVALGGFFFESKEEAEAVAEAARKTAQIGGDPAPPP